MIAGSSVVADPWAAALGGLSLDVYRLESCIGQGGFALVFEGINDSTKTRFAIKILRPGATHDAMAEFDREGQLLRLLNASDGVIDYVDGGTSTLNMSAPGGVTVPLPIHFHVLTLASGDVAELLLDPIARSMLSLSERLRLWRGVVRALKQMHQKGVAHRDLKASNCLLLVRGSDTRVKIADLGRARNLSAAPTLPPEQYLIGRGDLRFAPPEALLLQAGATPEDFLAADYYGLGSVLVELITGQPMTALALGDFGAVLKQSAEDRAAGVTRDLGVLNLKYQQVIDDVVADLPISIRGDATVLLNSLCHPVPASRGRVSYHRDRLSRERLSWVLRRVDIMIQRLEIEARQERRRERVGA